VTDDRPLAAVRTIEAPLRSCAQSVEDKRDRRGDTHFRARSWAGTAEAIPVSTLENRHVSRSIRWSTPRTGAHCFGCRLCPRPVLSRHSSGSSRSRVEPFDEGRRVLVELPICGRRTSRLLRDHWRDAEQAVRAPTPAHAARGGITAGAIKMTAVSARVGACWRLSGSVVVPQLSSLGEPDPNQSPPGLRADGSTSGGERVRAQTTRSFWRAEVQRRLSLTRIASSVPPCFYPVRGRQPGDERRASGHLSGRPMADGRPIRSGAFWLISLGPAKGARAPPRHSD
jgi:hypothetical protein